MSDSKQVKPVVTLVGNDFTSKSASDDPTCLTEYDYYAFEGPYQFKWISLIAPKLVELGYEVNVVSWRDDIKWSGTVVICNVWGYEAKRVEFLKWLYSLDTNPNVTLTLNDAKWVQYNMHKSYLLDIADVAISTRYVHLQNVSEFKIESLLEMNAGNVIAKGAVDANAYGYQHCDLASATAEQKTAFSKHIQTLVEKNGGALIQPFMPEVIAKGEFSAVFIGGVFSHCFLKVTCSKTEERVQGAYGGKGFHFKTVVDAEGQIRVDAEHGTQLLTQIRQFRPDLSVSLADIQLAVDQSTDIFDKEVTRICLAKGCSKPFLLRVDTCLVDGKLQVMELEGIEPYVEMYEHMQSDPDVDIPLNYAKAIIAEMQKVATASV